MFSKISRYHRLPEVVTLDAKERVLASKSLRLLTEVSGDFFHTVEEGDRLDLLAYKYYNQPRKWWRIVDASPAFLSPQALLGKESRTTVQIPLSWDGPAPPWSNVLQMLLQTLGAETAIMGTAEQAYPEVQYVEGVPDFVVNDAEVILPLQALADFLRQGPPPWAGLTEEALITLLQTVLAGHGIALGSAVRLLSVDINRWRIVEEGSERVFTFQLDEGEGLLNVYESATRYHWVVTVTYNRVTVSTGGILNLVEDRGFSAGPPAEVGRVGKSIVIPPRVA